MHSLKNLLIKCHWANNEAKFDSLSLGIFRSFLWRSHFVRMRFDNQPKISQQIFFPSSFQVPSSVYCWHELPLSFFLLPCYILVAKTIHLPVLWLFFCLLYQTFCFVLEIKIHFTLSCVCLWQFATTFFALDSFLTFYLFEPSLTWKSSSHFLSFRFRFIASLFQPSLSTPLPFLPIF